MKIKSFINGELEENCYLAYKNNYALIIDPGNVIVELEEFIEQNNLKIIAILITHYHSDHTGGLEHYKDLYKCELIDYKTKNTINLNCFNIEIIKCYGHTLDEVSFYFKDCDIMFTGDFLFKGTIGNYKNSNELDMQNSLKNIVKYPKYTIIYPGHGEYSSLEYELKTNPYLRGL